MDYDPHGTRASGPRALAVSNAIVRFQRAMDEKFSTAVEEIMERKVTAFKSQVHFDPDMAAEIFVLAPEADDTAPEG